MITITATQEMHKRKKAKKQKKHQKETQTRHAFNVNVIYILFVNLSLYQKGVETRIQKSGLSFYSLIGQSLSKKKNKIKKARRLKRRGQE